MSDSDKGIKITIPQALIVAIILSMIGWGWSVEKRMSSVESKGNLAARIEQLETAMLPILVDYKVKVELEKSRVIVKPPEIVSKEKDLKNEAKMWAQSQIPNAKKE